jgi:outer membrane receptor for ferrienterochelin and colicins
MLALGPTNLVNESVCRADGVADEAELHFQLGADAYNKGEYTTALDHFLTSNRLVPNINVVLNIALTFERMQRFADAHRYYVDALQDAKDQKLIQEVTSAIAKLAPYVAVLRVETDPPGATIYVDRKDLGSRGVTPRPLALSPGTYRLIVERDGYEPAESDEVVAKLGAVVRVALKLKRIVGTVRVDAAEANGAAVHVDEEDAPATCNAPCSFDLPPGQHILYFTNEGAQASPQQVTVTAGKTTRVKAMLNPLTGSMVVSADERDAVVQIDGRAVGFTPAVIPNVPVGRRRVRISLRGYAPIEREVVVKAGQQLQLMDIRLAPLRQISAASRVTEDIEDAPSSVTVIEG